VGAILPLPHVPPWRVAGSLYFFFLLYEDDDNALLGFGSIIKAEDGDSMFLRNVGIY
jgi:hypothetical protein